MDFKWIAINFLHDKNFVVNRPNGSGDYLLLFIKTNTVFEFVSKTIIAEPNSIIIFKKGTPQHYFSCENVLINSFIHFDVTQDEEKLLFKNIQFNKPLKMPDHIYIENLFEMLNKENLSFNPNKEQSKKLLFNLLIYKIEEQFKVKCPDTDDRGHSFVLSQLRSEIYTNPHFNWAINNMAKRCNLSVSYFQTLYKMQFGKTCAQDVICARLKMAERLLEKTNTSVSEISNLCGYKNIEHFMRQFKKEYKITPSQYRNKKICNQNNG